MAECFDPLTSQQFGNFPQAFSLVELVRAVIEMLGRMDDAQLILFPAIPSGWLVPGNTMTASNIPLRAERATIEL
jgi:hypothetical protein